jgi:shikimate kinase
MSSDPVLDLRGRHLIFVGLPGSGKTSVGRRVATKLGRGFIDLDAEIVRRHQASVADIFRTHGEPYFRQLEIALSAELVAHRPAVLAPGGGWIANEKAAALLRPHGRIIYLRTAPETALGRLVASPIARPLLEVDAPDDAMRRLYEARSALYEAADAAVDTDGRTADEVTALVLAVIGTG